MKITFFGAAQNVTGSKHLIEAGGFRLLLDCGLYQGRRAEAEVRNRTLPFDAKTIDAVILSHAHADHCGTLPVLVKNGFTGKIYCTETTAEIARFILHDSAKIQEEDAAYMNRHPKPGMPEAAPLYTSEDVENCLAHFAPVPYFRLSNEWTQLTPEIRFKFYDAGHILGSAVTLIEFHEAGVTKRIAFSGDLGNRNVPLLREPEYITESVDALLLECTYGDRNHRPFADAGDELAGVITDAVKNGRKIIVPAFALGRTQELIYALHKLVDAKKIPALPIYVDSPLSVNILEVFNAHAADFDEETWRDFGTRGEAPFIFQNLRYVHTIQESKKLNTLPGPYMIISSSGMCEGGRIRHHLKNNISDPNAVVLITGYQAEHTLGRRLQDGVKSVNIFGEPHEVKAKIMTLHEFSAHADQRGLLDYIAHTNGLKHLLLVHTEMKQAPVFMSLVQSKYPSLDVRIPAPEESVEL